MLSAAQVHRPSLTDVFVVILFLVARLRKRSSGNELIAGGLNW